MSVAYPEGVARHWNDGRRLLQEKTRELGTNDVEYLTEFVHSFECTGRVFGAGFSNGGHMIYLWGTGYAHRVELRFRTDIPFVNIAHQYLLRHPDYRHGTGDAQSLLVLRLHTLLTGIGATKLLALSFYPMKSCARERIVVVPPLLRREVLDLQATEGDYILGYMLNQGFENEVRRWHDAHPDVRLHFFWDKRDAPAELRVDDTLTLHRIDDEQFLHYMAGCRGYITTAGFESVCEALYLNKPVMLIPAHLEQEINAADASSIPGAATTGDSFDLSRLLDFMQTPRTFDHDTFRRWLLSAEETFIRELTSVVDRE